MIGSLLAIVALSIAVNSPLVAASKCPATYPLCIQGGKFNVTQYLGLWYTQMQSTAFPQGRNCYCETATYSLRSDGSVNVDNGCRYGSIKATETFATGDAKINNPAEPCDLSVRFPGAPVAGPYQILMSDYFTYSVVVSCFGAVGRDLDIDDIWILTRQPQVPQSMITGLTSNLTALGFGIADVVPVVQAGCPAPGSSQ